MSRETFTAQHVTTETYSEEERKATASCSCSWECVYAVGGSYAIGYIDTPNAAKRCARVAALYHRMSQGSGGALTLNQF